MKLLDNGYIEIIEFWGSDERIIEAARMSTNKGFQGWGPFCPDCKQTVILGENHCANCGSAGSRVAGDEKLLKYLYNHKHMTPFEMCGLTVEVQAPIFVFREWHRHRTQSYNELSARYTPLPDINYIPSVERLLLKGENNKQAQGLQILSREDAEDFRSHLHLQYSLAQDKYELALKRGVPKELARLVIPVGRYSKMRASANLRNWLQFLELRLPENAQWEIRQYANCLSELIKECFPKTWELFNEQNTRIS